MENYIVLEIDFIFGERKDTIHPVVLQDDQNLVLVDCGYTGCFSIIEKAMLEKNIDCKRLTHVVITHHDHDHMGGVYELKQKYPHVKVVSSRVEEPYISGKMKSLRLEQAEKLQAELPEEQKQFGINFCNVLKQLKPIEVDITVQDGDVIDWCGGCTVIDTAGHTPGHISLYLNRKKVLIAGDAVTLIQGKPAIANPEFTLDIKKAEESLQKIIKFGAEELICYHGGFYHKMATSR
jgi:Zn-dependent hydrolases, including glyoxylases